MGDKNTVSVIIYGQEYTFSGDMPREYILKLADKVDATMKELGDGKNQTLSKTAVLTALYVADEFYKEKESAEKLLEENYKLSDAAKKYESLWDEVKQSFAGYKQEQQNKIQLLERQIENQNIALDNAKSELENAKDIPDDVKNHITELEEKCKDIESSFFDIQMENIRLKNELSQYRQNINR